MNKQIFIEINNINKKLKKINDLLFSTETNNFIIHEYGKYLITSNNIIDIAMIPMKYYKKQLTFKQDKVDIYVNMFVEGQYNKSICNIPYKKQLIKTEKKTYKINHKSPLSFIVERHISFNENNDEYDLNFSDEDNDVLMEYYFSIKDDDEESHFIKEDIFSFLNKLN